MPTASSYTNKRRVAAESKNTKVNYPGGVANGTQPLVAGCGLDMDYSPITYTKLCKCTSLTTNSKSDKSTAKLSIIYQDVDQGIDASGLAFDSNSNLYVSLRAYTAIRNSTANITIAVNPVKPCFLTFIGTTILVVNSENSNIWQYSLSTQVLTKIAGTDEPGYGADDVLGTTSALNLSQLSGIVADSVGNIYICDTANNRIRKINNSLHITTIAGTGTAGYNSDGSALSTNLNNPTGLTIDSANNLYFCDRGNHIIRKLDIASGNIVTIAGTQSGFSGFSGDESNALAASLGDCAGIAIYGYKLYFCDSSNSRIRKVDLITNIITTIAGGGSGVPYSNQYTAVDPISVSIFPTDALCVDNAGNVYAANPYNGIVYKIVL